MKATALTCAAILFFACTSPPPQNNHVSKSQTKGPLSLVLIPEIIRENVQPFGINLSQHQYWGSSQIMKNLISTNPGFEAWSYGSIVVVASSAPGSFTDKGPRGAWKTGFWDHATYEVIAGPSKGLTGTIQSFTAPEDPKSGSEYVYEGTKGPQPGDVLTLRKEDHGSAQTLWKIKTSGNGTFKAQTRDLAPDSPGKQCLEVRAPEKRDLVAVHSYFDSKPHQGRPFLPLQGTWRLSFSAKGLAPDSLMQIEFKRLLKPHRVMLSQTVSLSQKWDRHQFDFQSFKDDQSGTLDLVFSVRGSSALLDDVSLEKVEDDNPTAFRKEVVETLRALKPGILRHWAGQLGDNLDNQLKPIHGRNPNGYSRWSDRPKNMGYALHEFLTLCKILKADPWHVVPITFSEQEMKNLMEYLAGSEQTPYGAIRAARGQAIPWTQVFSTIHLEFGNEAWNTIFKGATLTDPKIYGSRGAQLFAAARSHPAFHSEKFNLILGGQAAHPARNEKILKYASGQDSLAIAPYLMHKVDEPEIMGDLFTALFEEAQTESRTGKVQANNRISEDANVQLAVYEVNLHSTRGSISQENLGRFVSSAGAGMGVSLHMLNMLKELGVKHQCLYNFSQHSFLRGDKKSVPLWGAVRDLGPTMRKRPQYLALQMCNEALSGHLTTAQWRGERPTEMPEESLTPVFAFVNGPERALILYNLDPHKAVTFNLEIDGEMVREERLTFADYTDHNELEEKVTRVEQTMRGVTADREWTLPGKSMILLKWQTPQ